MLNEKAAEESGKAILLAVKKEMAKPRMAKSARERESECVIVPTNIGDQFRR
jgi:hypothetical protein